MAPDAATIQDRMIITQNTPAARKRRYSTMTRFLHTTPGSISMCGKQHQNQGKSNAPGVLSKAPVQGLSATQHVQSPPVPRAQAEPWSLMTANTTNWMGAKALITALGRHNNPRRPTFIVLQEHRNAGPDERKRAEPRQVTHLWRGGCRGTATHWHNKRHSLSAPLRKAQRAHPCGHLQLSVPQRRAPGGSILEKRIGYDHAPQAGKPPT